MKRRPIKKLIGKKIARIERGEPWNDELLFYDADGKLLFRVSTDMLFDKDGFYFNTEEIIK